MKDYSIDLSFDNGDSGIVDLKPTVFQDTRKIFEPLRDVTYFRNFSLGSWTIAWPNELDLAPEYMHGLAIGQK